MTQFLVYIRLVTTYVNKKLAHAWSALKSLEKILEIWNNYKGHQKSRCIFSKPRWNRTFFIHVNLGHLQFPYQETSTEPTHSSEEKNINANAYVSN